MKIDCNTYKKIKKFYLLFYVLLFKEQILYRTYKLNAHHIYVYSDVMNRFKKN